MRQMRGTRAAGALAVGLVVLAGCTTGTAAGPETIVTGTETIVRTLPPTGTVTTAPPSTVTITQTAPEGSSSAGAADFTPAPLPAQEPGECPYISDEQAKIFNGQGLGQTMIRPTKPYVVCDFYRSDGGWSASIQVAKAKDEATAVAMVDYAAPVKKSYPATLDGGWTGGYWNKEIGAPPQLLNEQEQAVYAVSKGKIVIIAASNEAESKKAKNFVVGAIENLKL